ncbi:antibiotic biosynthesis monooxygenase family protein [Phytohabitans aurantiacus]|nr:antibiotic biosynthesis monooxygenase family protein [Phytohabitans aurantiacus]
MAMNSLRVLLYHSAPSIGEIDPSYHEVSRRLAPVPGLMANELLRSVHDPTEFVVVSAWRDLAAFRAWESGPGHRASTAPLRAYRSNPPARPYGVYEVAAAYSTVSTDSTVELP